ncbi:sulfhydryl oxidase 1 [Corythoichthys intestinalis]|uniref:sulfhydryl oxidase 1 n=1 Tax=Corythoichthys intestinalis TaxID=161448 RepID=UPI0025A5940D|nr:sulfhydryl oxidase 1 [Corythoichthys intestinalis]
MNQLAKMARRSNRASSRSSREMTKYSRHVAVFRLTFCLLLLSTVAEAGLYTTSDQIVAISLDNYKSVLVNSSSAIVVEFYASWCGHCIAFSPVYKRLARDIKEWKPAVDLAAIDCADENNRKVCSNFSITGYPTLKFFHAFGRKDSTGQRIKGVLHDVQALRHEIIDLMEKQDPWPPACPPLEPTSQAEIDIFLETNNVRHLALIFENVSSYIGREVILDLLQFENIAVRRVLSTEDDLVTKLGVTEFPSCYLYYPGGNYTRLKVNIEARTFYLYALQGLPGVVRSGKSAPATRDNTSKSIEEVWRPHNRSRVYMADLESTLHYSLRVELAAHPVFTGEALTSLRNYISVLAKYFPGRPILMNLLKSLSLWLDNQTGDQVSYQAFSEILENSVQVPDAALPEGVRWVSCQGSQPHLRRYPCGMWTLFHLLTIQAKKFGGSDPKEVLNAMTGYISNFFGCRPCAEHFENMAKESLTEAKTFTDSILWLWSRHNRVNNRIAGALSEDPKFPKIQWPPPDLCADCHTVKDNGEHKWNTQQVLLFLQKYYSAEGILTDYLEDESEVLAKQKLKHASLLQTEAQKRIEREALEKANAPNIAAQKEEEEVADEDEEAGKALEPDGDRRQMIRRPSIVGMKPREVREDIVDLDSVVNRHFKAKAAQVATSSRVKRRTLQRNREERDSRLGAVLIDPNVASDERDLSDDGGLARRARWMSMLSIGFSKVDVSLCVILYFMSSTCLLAMYIFFKTRLRLRRAKVSLP